MLAYLVIREGSKWTDVFRLTPGRTVTIGRASTNQIVVKDERCSRNHAEIFMTEGRWTLRDLDSRNGTLLGGQRVKGDVPLTPGDVVRISQCQLAFVHDISQAFKDPVPPPPSDPQIPSADDGTVRVEPKAEISDSHVLNDSAILEAGEPTTITHRRNETRFLRPATYDVSTPKVGRAAAKLCQLAFELGQQTNIETIARLALDGLFESIQVDAGAVLVGKDQAEAESGELQIIASRAEKANSYHRVSTFLARSVLREGEAVLARNVGDDSTLGSRDSKGEITTTSIICAPIRPNNRVVGLIHLYSIATDRMLDAEDLEFTLAVAENMALALRNLTRQQQLADEVSQSRSELVQLRKRLEAESEIIGHSPVIARLHQEMAQAAPSRATVLIRGESGVGKELVARAMHYSSPRRKGPFVCLNCAALSETLLESELFGHERGAFTGATERKIGKFEAAHQGTLMLDEIGEMSSSIQAKFLRVLEGHPFERIGGNRPIKVDVRVIAATNRDLEAAVSEGKFRRDLYFRLHVVEIAIPPLRKRGDDVVELAEHFLQRFNAETGRRLRGFTSAALDLLRRYRWPGNVRELKNVVERAVVLAQNAQIDVDDLTLSNLATSSESGDLPTPKLVYEPLSLAEMEKRHILATLNATDWNKSRTASILGIERSTLDRKIRRYHLARQRSPNAS